MERTGSIAAILLSTWYEVELNTFLLSQNASITNVKEAAASLGFPHHVHTFGEDFLHEIVDLIVQEGFPNNGIQKVHREAIRELCGLYDVVA